MSSSELRCCGEHRFKARWAKDLITESFEELGLGGCGVAFDVEISILSP